MLSIEELQMLVERGLVHPSVLDYALAVQQASQEYQTSQYQAAIDMQYAQQDFAVWAQTQDAMFGTNVQQQSMQLQQRAAQASIKGRNQSGINNGGNGLDQSRLFREE